MSNPAPVEADKELTKPLNKYVVSIVGDKVTFTNDIWAAVEVLVDKHTGAACWQILNDIEQSLSSHTTPEGKDLLTRSYISNTLEFERMRLRNRPTQLGAKDD